jgi:hypothetical protein
MGTLIIGNFNRQDPFDEAKASEFTVETYRAAIDAARYLPRVLAIKLIEQVMLDHGLDPTEVAKCRKVGENERG